MGGGPEAPAFPARTEAATPARRWPTCPVVGTGTSSGLTRLPSSWDSPRRPETGTVMTKESMCSPRPASTLPSAPDTATRTASLVVAPNRCAAARRSSYLVRTTMIRRFAPVGRMSEQPAIRGGWSPPPAPMDARRSRHEPTTPRTAFAFLTSASWSRLATGGGGCGKAAPGTSDPGSTRLARTLSPPIPSARAWCRTTTRALRSSCSPFSSTTDHIGAPRLSGLSTVASAVSISSRSPPGARQRTSRTWRRRSNPASSTHRGPPQPKGAVTRRCRNRTTVPIRSATSSRTRDNDRCPSSSSTTPNCSGTSPRSIAKKARSVALARSMRRRVTLTASGDLGRTVTPIRPDNALVRRPGRVQGPRRGAGRPFTRAGAGSWLGTEAARTPLDGTVGSTRRVSPRHRPRLPHRVKRRRILVTSLNRVC